MAAACELKPCLACAERQQGCRYCRRRLCCCLHRRRQPFLSCTRPSCHSRILQPSPRLTLTEFPTRSWSAAACATPLTRKSEALHLRQHLAKQWAWQVCSRCMRSAPHRLLLPPPLHVHHPHISPAAPPGFPPTQSKGGRRGCRVLSAGCNRPVCSGGGRFTNERCFLQCREHPRLPCLRGRMSCALTNTGRAGGPPTQPPNPCAGHRRRCRGRRLRGRGREARAVPHRRRGWVWVAAGTGPARARRGAAAAASDISLEYQHKCGQGFCPEGGMPRSCCMCVPHWQPHRARHPHPLACLPTGAPSLLCRRSGVSFQAARRRGGLCERDRGGR